MEFRADEGCANVTLLYAPVSRSLAAKLNNCGKYRLLSLSAISELGRGSLIDALMLQNQRIEEKLTADESFRIFISLRNDLIDELSDRL